MQHVVQKGECLSSIAKRYGFTDWRLIYNHPANAEFRNNRPNPNLIYPGDILFIQDKAPKKIPISTSALHTFKVKAATTRLRLRIADLKDAGRGGLPYTLRVGGVELSGETSADGMLEHDIPDDAASAELEIKALGVKKQLELGFLDPPDTVSGIQGRLTKLGYDCGPIDGIQGPRTKAAVRAFQRANSPLLVDGICGPKTTAVLVDRYGC